MISRLRQCKKQQAECLQWGPAYQDHGLVFTREDGTPIHPDRFSSAFEDAVATSGLPKIRFHDLRHAHVTLGLQAGVPAQFMQQRLGH